MNVHELLFEYLKENISDRKKLIDYTKKNAMYYSIAYLLNIDVEKQFYYKTNRLRYENYVKNLFEIIVVFEKLKLNYIVFKGVVLANIIYDNPAKRYVGDLDIYVDKDGYSTALMALIKLRYEFRNASTFYNEHHIVMVKDSITIELHKNIYTPKIEIREIYLRENITNIQLERRQIKTFNITATLLHLVYHLYMDTYLAYCSLYNVLVNKSFSKADRFIYRAYEIALFSEKYFYEIKWDEIINDIKKQKLRIIFKTMIDDIIKIFSNAFPKHFIDVVNNMEFISDERDTLYKCIIDEDSSNENIDIVLSNFIDFQWNTRASENIYIDSFGSFTLDNLIVKEPEINNDYQLSCTVQIEKMDSGIKLEFKVSNNDFCFSEIKDYNTQTSDGVHLVICGTQKYSYNSIFLFPKIVDDKTIIVPVNVLNEVNSEIDDSLISASYEEFETEYIITAILKNKFLKTNNIDEYFYLGLVISDCSNKTKNRKSELILADPYNEWYNPAYLAKIRIV